jgi:hypothetical protein
VLNEERKQKITQEKYKKKYTESIDLGDFPKNATTPSHAFTLG